MSFESNPELIFLIKKLSRREELLLDEPGDLRVASLDAVQGLLSDGMALVVCMTRFLVSSHSRRNVLTLPRP
jgi:hypothetical protein